MMDVVRELDFLNNEAVEGELLAGKLAAGPLAADLALQYAVEIGAALNAAHTRGIVHGSISPDHVMIAARGAVLLDPRKGPGPSSPRYRSPEQVRGENIDSRTDIFAFGVLLYEMANGRRAFPGEGAELDDAILNQPPSALMSNGPVHAALEGVIAGCLEKDPARRRQRIQNAVIELKLAGRSLPSVSALPIGRRPSPGPMMPLPGFQEPPVTAALPASAFLGQTPGAANTELWLATRPSLPAARISRRLTIIGIATMALAATGVSAVMLLHQRPVAPPVKFAVTAPEHTSFPGTPSVSPDGLSLTYSAVGPEGQRMLWLQGLDEMHAKVIPGTQGAFAPFWSPDSEYIAFFAGNALKKIRVRNTTPEARPEMLSLADAEPSGGTWNKDGVILFAPSMKDGLYRIPATGGKPTPVLKPDAKNFERALIWPQFLPDGNHFIYFVQTGVPETTGIYAASLDAPRPVRLFPSETNAVYSPVAGKPSSTTGYLLYMANGDLMGQGFDAAKLELHDDARQLATKIGSVATLSLAPISVSSNAVLVYQTVGAPVRQLISYDRTGNPGGVMGEPGMWGPPRISPDGTRVVAGKAGKDNTADLWMFDSRGNASQFLSTPGMGGYSPVWSPDGSRVAFWSDAEGARNIYVKALNGAKPELLFKNDVAKVPTDWSKDGRFLLFNQETATTGLDVWALSLADKHAAPVLDTIHSEGYAAVSPDGHWLAYQSDDSGRFEVYVQPFEGLKGGTKRRWKISTDTGNGPAGPPRWRGDGKELFYVTIGGDVMSANVAEKDSEFVADPPKLLFNTRPIPHRWNLFDVSPDGQRFVINVPLEWSNSSVITVVTSWTEKLKS